MTVRADSAALAELIDPAAEVERLGTGFTFTEGPVWNREGGFLLFSDMPGDVRRRWSPQDGITEVRRPNDKGNGMVYDASGGLLICQHVISSLVRETPDGAVETLASHCAGEELNSPNDVVCHSNCASYFMDPTYGRMEGFGVLREPRLSFQGVYRIAGAPVLVVPRDTFEQPNGLCFPPTNLCTTSTTRRGRSSACTRWPPTGPSTTGGTSSPGSVRETWQRARRTG